MQLPNLAKVATADLVETIGGNGKFSAAYINWSRTLHLLREHAPGWLPELVPAADGGIVHAAPQGAFLLIRFRHMETNATTPAVPQAVMDARNAAIPLDKITARDITDTHRRGACMAAALTFGLAYELWAKLPLESGYAEAQEQAARKVTPLTGVWESQPEDVRQRLFEVAAKIGEYMDAGDAKGAHEYLARLELPTDEKAALWTQLDSKTRSALKRAHAAAA